MGDGAVKFVTESIEAGDQNEVPYGSRNPKPGYESPYGLWGALGPKTHERRSKDSNNPSVNLIRDSRIDINRAEMQAVCISADVWRSRRYQRNPHSST
ncbi:protein containing DUF1559 [Rhodopirellula maiorica SM1]|uniref:Protein containing DUF1559 n=2 Tax=Novipirellula TaxID=2795426 RepID=M5S4S0_9BACT|nr:protein containing DUF1559 [Rhodopirellula maiorica SM1]